MDHERAGDSLVRLVDFARSLDEPTASKVSWILGEAKILTESTYAMAFTANPRRSVPFQQEVLTKGAYSRYGVRLKKLAARFAESALNLDCSDI